MIPVFCLYILALLYILECHTIISLEMILSNSSAERRSWKLPFMATEMRPVSSDTTIATARAEKTVERAKDAEIVLTNKGTKYNQKLIEKGLSEYIDEDFKASNYTIVLGIISKYNEVRPKIPFFSKVAIRYTVIQSFSFIIF